MIRVAAHELRLVAVALQYFTRLPVPRLHRFDAAWLSQAVRWFPFAGLVVGAIAAGVLALASHVLPWPLACGLALAASIVVTGAFHEDGLADTFDALGGHVPRERALAIMRDSRIGTYGALALAVALLLRWQVLVVMPGAVAPIYLLTAHPLARAAAALLMAGLDYVRIDDDAKAKPVARPMGRAQALVTGVMGIAPVAVAAVLRPSLSTSLGCGVLAALLVHVACRRWFRRRLGGYTGDGLGCAEQLGEIVIGLAIVAALQTHLR